MCAASVHTLYIDTKAHRIFREAPPTANHFLSQRYHTHHAIVYEMSGKFCIGNESGYHGNNDSSTTFYRQIEPFYDIIALGKNPKSQIHKPNAM